MNKYDLIVVFFHFRLKRPKILATPANLGLGVNIPLTAQHFRKINRAMMITKMKIRRYFLIIDGEMNK